MNWKIISVSLLFLVFVFSVDPYPIDGYDSTGIRRLKRLELIEKDSIKGRKLIPGALKTMEEVRLHLLWTWGDSLDKMLIPDSILQHKIEKLFPNRDESISLALIDITPGKETRYAQIKSNRGYQPGSVGKLVVISGFFNELKKIFPEDFEKRRELLKTKFVRAGKWAIYDEHTVPFFDPETNKYFRRVVGENDVF